MKIKICGLQTIEDIHIINETNPDFAGFIFASKSKRKISYNQAFIMKQELKPNIKAVGVFVDEDIKNIFELLNYNILDYIQLHGHEDNDYIEKLKIKIPVIKAFCADENLEEKINQTKADYVLIDSKTENQFGGTGKTFDWNLIPDKYKKKIFLSGGLNSENILNAIDIVNPYCVDINSGVETAGKKDKNKVIEIMRKIKGYKDE
ncbi:MAG: phosphoribosylanthranilate isomerase [Candidatus Gastranaerophilales bacterium]|nr:phosphoribosylanthranilate isomerase [Candidatus Gastranaerophilales bacterium]